MKTDLEIAHSVPCRNITEIAAKLNLAAEDYDQYGSHKAKLSLNLGEKLASRPNGKLILVTAITPTPAGEGKTTVTVGLTDGMRRRGLNAVAALREPSLGPVFGIKGGAAGGGYSQVIPMEEINLHFTGDFHAISAANNLIAAMIDNHIFHGNALDLDPEKITWRRCLDMNDRALRHIVSETRGKGGYSRETGFDITAACEIMAIFCLASSLEDLKNRIANIIIGTTRNGRPVRVSEIKAEGAATALLAEAFRPNLVQTLEGTPVLIHGGPFANIAHGCNSLIATKLALKLADYVVTEAGFGADLGAEKFLDIKCRKGGLTPSATVLVATIRALKMHGGLAKDQLAQENLEALQAGLPNLLRHIDNLTQVYHLPVVVAINRFSADTDAEIAMVKEACAKRGVKAVLAEVWAKGGEGALELADAVAELTTKENKFEFSYPDSMSIREKIITVAKRIYHANGVNFSEEAEATLAQITGMGLDNLPVCIAKTQYSFSDDATLIGAPENFDITIRSIRLSAGAGFVVVLTGVIMTMPGLPSVPSAEHISVDGATGELIGIS